MALPLSRSERLLKAAAPVMERALRMRFVTEVTAGTISDADYADYLELEAAFVETATRMHGLAVWGARGKAATRR
ncbi:hypothetical protein [Streptomyces asiaticus]